ncbi:MAG TPA: 4Fe-4S binding protein [Desulfomonilaceae bacterium]|nr:4Fe-4S binding protein [Desulfomonilaceae bacterium]
MTETGKLTAPAPERMSLVKTTLFAFPIMVLTFMMLSGGRIPAEPKKLVAMVVTFLLFNTLFFLMIRSEKTDNYRATLFCMYAVFFSISFISHYIEVRGSMSLSAANVLECKTPFCHIVIPMTIIPIAFTRTIIFPGTMVGSGDTIASMFVIWIGATLAMGRGFCGWACFFGGWDDGFSRILKKPFIKNINPKWHYLPYAVLFAVALASAVYLFPVYCAWLCPFKTVSEFAAITSTEILIQTIIFVSLFIGLVVVLPILTKRRTQCGLFCPFGAFQSFANKIDPFEVRINQEACVKCRRCMQVCPTFSVNEASIENGKPRLTCIKCGKCIDNCPKKALSYHIKGTPLGGNIPAQRLLFLYPGFLFLTTMSGGNIQDVIVRAIKLVTTGSIF